jgi:hypothetical protein
MSIPIPGSNLFEFATDIINTDSFDYFKFNSRSTNLVGNFITVFDNPVTLQGSVQPVQTIEMKKLGLNFKKQYITIHVSTNILDFDRGTSGDEVVFGSERYKVETSDKWFDIDGWQELLCVKITN